MTQPKIIDSSSPSDEQLILVKKFQEFEGNQVENLDASAKRLVEITISVLGLLFAITAFGDKFPPPYLNTDNAKLFTSLALIFYMFSMLCALVALQPRSYKSYRHNITEMRGQFDKIISRKSFLVTCSGVLFLCGTGFFSVLTLFLVINS